MSLTPFVMNLLLAMCLGALIGAERQWRQRMAGLRTNALVATGAAVFILSSYATSPDSPGRIAAQIVSGIGFLGAGVIMREGMNIRGLNTAATLWCSAGIGVLVVWVCTGMLPSQLRLFCVPTSYYVKQHNVLICSLNSRR